MSMSRLFAVAAATALMSGAALAQTTPNPAAPADPAAVNPAAPPAPMTDPVAAPSALNQGVETAGVVPMSSQSPEAQALLKAGDANVVSNPPVADTPENRALYGKPMSNAGKRSAAKGN